VFALFPTLCSRHVEKETAEKYKRLIEWKESGMEKEQAKTKQFDKSDKNK
jgi:hypothetical protein